MCFDSNGKEIDRRKLWKRNGSEFRTCGTLHSFAEQVNKLPHKKVDHVFISVGTNDLDMKDHEQVFGEYKIILEGIRRKFPGIKIIINELIPRKDARNVQIGKLNSALGQYASSQSDVTIATQSNITTTMLHDDKHLHSTKVPLYAKNIINGLLKAYGIQSKSELFIAHNQHPPSVETPFSYSPHNTGVTVHDFSTIRNTNTPSNIQQRLERHAEYEEAKESQQQKENVNRIDVIQKALEHFSSVIMNHIQR